MSDLFAFLENYPPSKERTKKITELQKTTEYRLHLLITLLDICQKPPNESEFKSAQNFAQAHAIAKLFLKPIGEQ